jgi:hypothetical protein
MLFDCCARYKTRDDDDNDKDDVEERGSRKSHPSSVDENVKNLPDNNINE